jgi:hypothetical protein
MTNRILNTIEIVLVLILISTAALVTYYIFQSDTKKQRLVITGFVEAEDMKVLLKSDKLPFTLQSTEPFADGSWSNKAQMFAKATAKDQFVELEMPQQEAGPYLVSAYFTMSYDYGIIEIEINGKVVKKDLDLWSLLITSTGPVELGVQHLKAKDNRMTIKVVGHNARAASPFYQFGIDGITVEKVVPVNAKP